MRQTPRNLRSSSSRGIGTLIGNGWLRESPREREAPAGWGWNSRSKSALRKCMFMPVPEEIRRLVPQLEVFQAAPAPPPPARVSMPEAAIVPHRRDPRKDARELPAYLPAAARAHQQHGIHVRNAHKLAQQQAAAAAGKSVPRWWEDPVALGSLLILAPPIGLAALWSSQRYSRDARWALTVMTALMMCLASAILVIAIALVLH